MRVAVCLSSLVLNQLSLLVTDVFWTEWIATLVKVSFRGADKWKQILRHQKYRKYPRINTTHTEAAATPLHVQTCTIVGNHACLDTI